MEWPTKGNQNVDKCIGARLVPVVVVEEGHGGSDGSFSFPSSYTREGITRRISLELQFMRPSMGSPCIQCSFGPYVHKRPPPPTLLESPLSGADC